MENIFLVAILFFVSAVLTNAQNKQTDQQAVQKTVVDLFQALANRDLVNLKKNCTSDILILENGSVWSLDTLMQKVSQNTAPDFKRINTFEFIDTDVNGKIAWTTYNNQAELSRNGKNVVIKWLETAILSKESGQWKTKVLHSTLLKRS
jgi:ketosteroid isomerase-like protein